jgi:hypothetical protein
MRYDASQIGGDKDVGADLGFFGRHAELGKGVPHKAAQHIHWDEGLFHSSVFQRIGVSTRIGDGKGGDNSKRIDGHRRVL